MESLSVMVRELGNHVYFFFALISLLLIYISIKTFYAIRIMKKSPALQKKVEGVSIIITSRNCGEFLERNLEAFLTQDYDDYEVIVVDECSDDRTTKILESFQEKYSHLKCTKIPFETKFRNTKKIAINIGVLSASNDILLFSEITAYPVSKDWVRIMQEQFDEDTVGVVGYSNFSRTLRKIDLPYLYHFLNFIRLINQFNRGYYYLGNGYNMGYRRSAYMACRGFTYNSQIYLGYDSDIIRILSSYGVVKIVKDKRTYIEIQRNADRSCQDLFMYRLANIKTWNWREKLRMNWLSIIKFLLLLLFVYLFVNLIVVQFVLLALFILYAFDFSLLLIYLRHFEQTKLGLTSFIYSTVGFFYTLYLTYGCSLFIGKKWR